VDAPDPREIHYLNGPETESVLMIRGHGLFNFRLQEGLAVSIGGLGVTVSKCSLNEGNGQ
jgi:hypothetical protein